MGLCDAGQFKNELRDVPLTRRFRWRHLAATLAAGCVFCTAAAAEVSDRVFEALVGEQVTVELDGNIIVKGLLKNVEGSSVIIIHADGEVMEVSKGTVSGIRAVALVENQEGEGDTGRGTDLVVIQQQQQQQEQQEQQEQQSEQQQQQQQVTALIQYEQLKKDAWGPFALNLFLGFGIGSFVLGDTTAGLLLAGADLVGLGLVIAGVGAAAEELRTTDEAGSGATLLVVGYGVILVSRIAGAIVPFGFANGFNEKLRRDLGITSVSLLLPEVDADSDDRYGVMVSFAM